MDIVILSIVVALAVILSVVATWRARSSIGLTGSQKTAQILLAWLLPFIGAVAVIVMSIEPTDIKNPRAGADPGADALSGGGYYGGDGGGHHHGSHGHGDAGHGGDGGGGH